MKTTRHETPLGVPRRLRNDRHLARALRENWILTDEQVKEVARLMSAVFRREFPVAAGCASASSEDIVRLSSLRARCARARQERGFDVKAVARLLKVPQYRVRAVEDGSRSEMKPEAVRLYVEFLGLQRWARRWAKANPELAERIGLAPTSGHGPHQRRPAR